MKYKKSNFNCKRDGFTIRGTQYIPKGENLPIAIVSHEFLMGRFSVRRYARDFAKMGYAAFCFDFVGGGSISFSSGRHRDMTVWTELDDLKTVISRAKNLPQTDGGKPVLMGCSQGGLVSALAAAELQDEISKLVLFYPALCIPDDARAGSMIFNTKFNTENIPEAIKCGPFVFSGEYPKTVMSLDVFKAIAKYRGEVFIAHGTADKIVNLSYARRAQEAYSKEKCSLMIIPKAGHIFSPVQDRAAVAGIEHFMAGWREMFAVDVKITRIIPKLKGIRSTLEIPFTGDAEGDYFKGRILPGGVDIQKRKGFKTERLCASYTLEGKDYTGADCSIEIQNIDEGKGWKPVVRTDSEALSFLNEAECFAFVKQRGLKGPIVRIFA